MKKGFTLVELSIVLVIIGLLIGGILVGQSLINSAKLQNEVRKISQWSIAITQFKDKFKQYPGDSDLFSSPGNNNGNTNNALGTCPATSVIEWLSAWSHLSQAQILGGENYTYISENRCIQNYKGMTPTPEFKDYYGNALPAGLIANRTAHSFDEKSYEYYINNFYKFYDLMALEKKLDDGVPSQSTGRIESFTYADGTDCNDSGAASSVAIIDEVPSKADVICSTNFYFNQHEIITAN